MFYRNPKLVMEAEQRIVDGVKDPVQRRVLANTMAAANEEAELDENRRLKEYFARQKRGKSGHVAS